MKKYLPISICIVLCGCDATELQNPTFVVESKDFITLVPVDESFRELTDKQSILADSGSVCLLKAVLGPRGDGAREIVFSSTAGVFTEVGQLPTTDSKSTFTITPAHREVVIQLNALDVINEDVVVSATTGNVSDVLKLSFTTSYPYDFKVNPVSTSILKTDEVEISVTALVGEGSMSEGQYLQVSAIADDGILLDYPQFVKVVNQKASFKVVNKSQTPGEASISLELQTADDETKTKDVKIMYN